MFKYYILTSGGLNCLIRQFHTLKPSESVVVINTTKKENEEALVKFCSKNSIEYHVTKSDGTPATGKNALLDVFLSSDNEYMVQVDGDDYITPYGRNLYRTIAMSGNAPDILCLTNQISLVHYDIDAFDGQYDSRTVVKDFIPDESLRPELPYTKTHMFGPSDRHQLAHTFESTYDILDRGLCMELAKARIDISCISDEYGEKNDTHNRIVFYSRKGASFTAFDNTLLVGEDTVQYYKLKKFARDGLLDMKLYDEANGRTYIYMEDSTGIVSVDRASDSVPKEEYQLVVSRRWRWLLPLREELNKIINNLPRYQLESIKEPHYEINKK